MPNSRTAFALYPGGLVVLVRHPQRQVLGDYDLVLDTNIYLTFSAARGLVRLSLDGVWNGLG